LGEGIPPTPKKSSLDKYLPVSVLHDVNIASYGSPSMKEKYASKLVSQSKQGKVILDCSMIAAKFRNLKN